MGTTMTARHIARRGIPALAAATLLLAGCGGTTEDAAEATSASPPATEAPIGSDASDAGGSDGGGSDGGGSPAASGSPSSGDGEEDSGGNTWADQPSIAYEMEFSEKDVTEGEDGHTRIAKSAIEASLAEKLWVDPSAVTCDEGVVQLPGVSTVCSVDSVENDEGQNVASEWTVYPVQSVGGGKLPGIVAFKHTEGVIEPLDEEAVSGLTGSSSSVAGLGFGTMHLSEDIPADQLAEETKAVVNFHQEDASADEKLDSVTCEEDLQSSTGVPVECDGTLGNGSEVELTVYPGHFVNDDAGLFVAMVDQA